MDNINIILLAKLIFKNSKRASDEEMDAIKETFLKSIKKVPTRTNRR